MRQTDNEKPFDFLKDYVSLECVYSNTELFRVGKKYIIKTVGDFFIDVLGENDKGVTLFGLNTINARFIPANLKIDDSVFSTPSHYQGAIQPIDLINAQDLNFNLGNVVKYVCRAGKKDGESKEKDLKKALDYINFELERVTK